MTLELLCQTIQKQTKRLAEPEVVSPAIEPLKPREIQEGIREIYRETGEFMEILEASLGTTSFEVEKPDFSESDLPEDVVEFFESQYGLMPEDITFGVRVGKDTNGNHNLFLELSRRGSPVSDVSFCSYVRSKKDLACHLWTRLDHDELQPIPTIEAKGKLEARQHSSGDRLARDTFGLQTARVMLSFAINEAVKHIESQPKKQGGLAT